MPLYDYRCRACQHVTEVRHDFKETFEEACSKCGGEMARVFNPAGIVFKGSGFYINDSRKSSESAKSGEGTAGGEKTGATAASGEAASAPAKSDTPAAAPAAAPSKSESAA